MSDTFQNIIQGNVTQINQGGTGNTNTVRVKNIHNENVSDFLKEFKNLKEEFSKKLQEALDSVNVPEKEFQTAKKMLERIFLKFTVLEKESQKFLVQAEYLKTNISHIKEGDYSPVVALYGRAVEFELKNKLDLSADMLGSIQNELIGLINEYYNPSKPVKKILNRISIQDLSKSIFSESYLGYGATTFDSCTFSLKIRNQRNRASHSGEDSFFTEEEADSVIKDMTDFLLEWSSISFSTSQAVAGNP
ncbi:MAG TPA: hypothetical protein PL048_12420 [Leptospiraceae bacterium]|nr:hypothetical protein [Leptospiraceae bacterium]HMY67188.1 hypothetical protein [Leptospiraceae bacterium]HMZ59577.1 hypothetical protein [Leptospiraceae bacterium]HNF15962.1 hypothetical protein [Leptospiraceae bacterium]HNF27966.1 hypothetical protein [Leptospiraceae bacterium]